MMHQKILTARYRVCLMISRRNRVLRLYGLESSQLTGDARPRFFESLRFARGAGAARAKR